MRIRTIKPEFWRDELVSSWPAFSRLLYIALWNEADDFGRLRANPRYLSSTLFPYDDIDIEAVMKPVVDAGKLVLYVVNGQTYGFLPQFAKHQYIKAKGESKLPEPPKTTEVAAKTTDLTDEKTDSCKSLNDNSLTFSRQDQTNSGISLEDSRKMCQEQGTGKGKERNNNMSSERQFALAVDRKIIGWIDRELPSINIAALCGAFKRGGKHLDNIVLAALLEATRSNPSHPNLVALAKVIHREQSYKDDSSTKARQIVDSLEAEARAELGAA